MMSGPCDDSLLMTLKDVRTKIFQSIDFLNYFYVSQIICYLCQKCKKNGDHRLRFRDKACGKLP